MQVKGSADPSAGPGNGCDPARLVVEGCHPGAIPDVALNERNQRYTRWAFQE